MTLRSFTLLGVMSLLFACASVAACQQHDPDKEGIAASIIGIDYLPDHVSVQDFTVNGVDAGRAGGGGSSMCCVMLPNKWQPGMTATVTWNVTNWRDCNGKDYKAAVAIDKYDEPGSLYVSFMPDGTVRITVSALDTPFSPGYKGPHIPIPDKHPWDKWPPHTHCAANFK